MPSPSPQRARMLSRLMAAAEPLSRRLSARLAEADGDVEKALGGRVEQRGPRSPLQDALGQLTSMLGAGGGPTGEGTDQDDDDVTPISDDEGLPGPRPIVLAGSSLAGKRRTPPRRGSSSGGEGGDADSPTVSGRHRRSSGHTVVPETVMAKRARSDAHEAGPVPDSGEQQPELAAAEPDVPRSGSAPLGPTADGAALAAAASAVGAPARPAADGEPPSGTDRHVNFGQPGDGPAGGFAPPGPAPARAGRPSLAACAKRISFAQEAGGGEGPPASPAPGTAPWASNATPQAALPGTGSRCNTSGGLRSSGIQCAQLLPARPSSPPAESTDMARLCLDGGDVGGSGGAMEDAGGSPRATPVVPSLAEARSPSLTAAPPSPGAPPLSPSARGRQLHAWDLPAEVCSVLESKLGPSRLMHAWQADCLSTPGVREGANLVYSAPTGGGKSLVAEVLLLRRVLLTRRLGLLVLPYVSLCEEKHAALAAALAPEAVPVVACYGAKGGGLPPPGSGPAVAVCTLEKANSVVCRLAEEGRLAELACVVVDELHMAGDADRGFLLELMLTKLMFFCAPARARPGDRPASGGRLSDAGGTLATPGSGRGGPPSAAAGAGAGAPPADMARGPGLQLIAMSATLPNAHAAAEWLRAALYETDYRPVPLTVYVRQGGWLVDADGREPPRPAPAPAARPAGGGTNPDPDGIGPLVAETVRDGHGVLIFCPYKSSCPNVIRMLLVAPPGQAPLVSVAEAGDPRPGAAGDEEEVGDEIDVRDGDEGADGDEEDSEEAREDARAARGPGGAACAPPPPLAELRAAAAAELRRLAGAGGGRELAEAVALGGAWHHAGLSMEERAVVERYFRLGAIRVLAATSTLAAGVNLPARRVIFRQPYGLGETGRSKQLLDAARFRQMAGRAGRMGLDDRGEAVLVCTREAAAEFKLTEAGLLAHVAGAALPPLRSALGAVPGRVRRALLEGVVSGAVRTFGDVERYMRCTLWAHTADDWSGDVTARTVDTVRWLVGRGFLRTAAAELAPFESPLPLPPVAARAHAVAASPGRSPADTRLEAEPLGRAAFASQLGPEQALLLLYDLLLARDAGLVLSTDLHLAYLCCPLEGGSLLPADVDELKRWAAPACPAGRVAERVGLRRPDDWLSKQRKSRLGPVLPYAFCEADVAPDAAGPGPPRAPADVPPSPALRLRALQRLQDARLLEQLVQEVPLAAVAARYGVERGKLQALQDGAARMAGVAATFCQRMAWPDLEALLSKFQGRLAAGARGDVVELTDIPFVKAGRARALFQAGLRTAEAVAASSVPAIYQVLAAAAGGAARGAEKRAAREILKGARAIVAARAKELLGQAAQLDANVVQAPAAPEPGGGDDGGPPAMLAALTAALREPPGGGATQAGAGAIPRGPGAPGGPAAGWVVSPVQSEADFARVLEEWARQPLYGFALDERAHAAAPGGGGSGCGGPGGLGGIHGLALCWRRPLVHYLPLGARRPAWLAPVLATLARPGARKVAFALKRQLQLLALAAAAEAARESALRASAARGLYDPAAVAAARPSFDLAPLLAGLVVGAPAEDVRVALWLEQPEAPEARDGEPSVFGRGARPARAAAAAAQAAGEGGGPLAALLHLRQIPPREWAVTASDARVRGSAGLMAACRGAAGSLVLHAALRRPLEAHGLLPALDGVEMRLVPVLAAMELWGILWSPRVAAEQLARLRRKLGELEAVARACLPPEQQLRPGGLNLAGTVDVSRLLYDVLRFVPPPGAKRGRGGAYPTAAAALAELRPQAAQRPPPARHVVDAIIEWRSLKKYVDAVLDTAPAAARAAAAAAGSAGAGAALLHPPLALLPAQRVSASFMHTASETGRLATEEPNLQCMPRDRDVLVQAATQQQPISGLLPALEAGGGPSAPGPYGRPGPAAGAWEGALPSEHGVPPLAPPLSSWGLDADEGDDADALGQLDGADAGAPAGLQRTISARSAFVAREGCVLLSADYQQLELRLMAHFSQDAGLCARLHAGEDPFRGFAAEWYRKPQQHVSPSERAAAKAVAYGLLYGKGKAALAVDLGVSEPEAAALMASFLASMPALRAWLEKVVADCRGPGAGPGAAAGAAGARVPYVETLCRRRRYLPQITAAAAGPGPGQDVARGLRRQAERRAVNTVCQGSAADVCKLAMVAVLDRIVAANRRPAHANEPGVEGEPGGGGGGLGLLDAFDPAVRLTAPLPAAQHRSPDGPGPHAGGAPGAGAGSAASPAEGRCRLLLQIHDELLLEVERGALPAAAAMVRECMEGAATRLGLRVPLPVQLRAGRTWGALQPLDVEAALRQGPAY